MWCKLKSKEMQTGVNHGSLSHGTQQLLAMASKQ